MVKITKVYTRQGDSGETHLAGGHRVAKDSARISVIGDIDELNASIGFAIASMQKSHQLQKLKDQCVCIQHQLFNLGSHLAVLPQDRRLNTPVIIAEDVSQLEKEIDAMNATLPALTSFILPGGGEIATRLHLCRTICRRAERSLVALFHQWPQLEIIQLSYLNRLSDWLFVAARYVTSQLAEQELLWQPK